VQSDTNEQGLRGLRARLVRFVARRQVVALLKNVGLWLYF
jgi:hypothetical protein